MNEQVPQALETEQTEAQSSDLPTEDSPQSLSAYERWELPEVEASDFSSACSLESLTESGVLTAEQIEGIRNSAHKEGYQVGEKAGFASGEKQLQQTMKQLNSLLLNLAEPLENFNNEVETQAVQLIMAVAEQVLFQELKTSPEHILKVVEQAKRFLPLSEQQVTLHVHPEDAVLIHQMGVEFNSDCFEIKETSTMERGGCRLSSTNSEVNAEFNLQVKKIFKQVFGVHADSFELCPDDEEAAKDE